MLPNNRWLLCAALVFATGCSDPDSIVSSSSGIDAGLAPSQGSSVGAFLDASLDATRRHPDSSQSSRASDADVGDAGEPRCGDLLARLRDFKDTHPDFEKFVGSGVKGIVLPALGADGKPVLDTSKPLREVTSPESFAQWYRDTPGVNLPIEITIPLQPVADSFEYSNQAFFPLDGLGFGEQGRKRNYHFTTEIHTSFLYRGGEQFTFSGDDDLWIFVNGKLALDLGGTHSPQMGTVDFDAQAALLGITPGQSYKLDIFHAERHTTASNFKIRTNIDCFRPVILI